MAATGNGNGTLLGRHAKAIVALLGAISVALDNEWPSQPWSKAIIAGIAAFLVYFIPNSPPNGLPPAEGQDVKQLS